MSQGGFELSDENVGVSGAGRFARTARRLGFGNVMSNLLFSSRFVTIWIAGALLLLVCQIVAPATLSSSSWAILLPIGSIVAVVALGQMLVIMMGGIDLSMAGAISLLANILVGVAKGSDDRLPYAILIVFAWAVVIGLVNGLLVAILDLNPLIVTLSTGLILLGITAEYRLGTANESQVPDALSDFMIDRFIGISKTFWFVVVLTLLVALILRSTAIGRRFQAVGANRRAAWMAGIRVRLYVIAAYIFAALAAGVAGILVGGIVNSPGVDPGACLSARAGRRGRTRRRGAVGRPRQRHVDVGRRLLRHHPQPDAARPRPRQLVAERRVRAGDHPRHGDLRRPHRRHRRPPPAAPRYPQHDGRRR